MTDAHAGFVFTPQASYVNGSATFVDCNDTSITLSPAQAAGIVNGTVLVGILDAVPKLGSLSSCTLLSRVVIGVQSHGGFVTLTTMPATLDDVFSEYDINIPDVTAAAISIPSETPFDTTV